MQSWKFSVILCVISFFLIPFCSGVVFCPDDRYTMPISNTLPWGAVGYMDNGCTATLIDSQHIVAAAHCFVWDNTGSWQGSWQGNVYPKFYPNFNSTRPSPPSVAIDRAVVGTRVETGGEFQASDWGIGHLANPVTDFPSIPMSYLPNYPVNNLISSGYGRDPYFFTPQCGNTWNQSALVDPKCTVYTIDKDQLFFDCACVGGNSGSPIIYKNFGDTYNIIGVIHGPGNPLQWHGWWNIAGIQVDTGSPVSVTSRGSNNLDVFVVGNDGGIHNASWDLVNGWKGWGRVLGLEAKPGSLVSAVSRSANWLDIFTVGNDGGIYTAAWYPDFTDGWHGWWNIPGLQVDPGTPVSVASRGPNNLDVFVVGNNGGIYYASWGPQTNYVWNSFSRIHNLEAKPGSRVNAISRSSNKLDIFVTGNDGKIYTSSLAPTNGNWQSWVTISGIEVEPGSPVSAASRGSDNLDIFVVNKSGIIKTAAKGPENVWEGWWSIDDNFKVDQKSYIAAVSRGTDKLDIFVVGKDNKAYNTGWESCGWRDWQKVLDLSFKSGSYLGATSRSTDWLDIFAANQDSGVYTAAWYPSFTCEAVSQGGPAPGHLNAGPSGKRFVYAPKYAENVALARYVDGSPRTQIFVADSDSNLVVTRSRNGNSVTDGFSTFDTLGPVKAPKRIAAFLQTNGKPQVVVASANGRLNTRAVAKDFNSWNPWTTIDLPWRVNKVFDVDAAYDSEGTNQIFIVGNDGDLYTRARVNKQPDSAWKAWEKLTTSGKYRTVTALRQSDGTEQVFLVDSSGSLATLWQVEAKPTSSWSAPINFESPFKIKIPNSEKLRFERINDIDAAWTEDEQVQLFAVDQKGGLWIRTMMRKDTWNRWQPWDTHLYAPQSKSPQPPPEGIVSLTASRWQEETNGDIVPVVFATDKQGNVYYTTHTRTGGWSAWNSSYH